MRLFALLFFGLALALLPAASPAGDKPKKEPIPTFDEEDAGKTFPLESGGKARIKLKGNPTTGFLWEVAQNNPKLLKQLDKGTVIRPKDAPPGAGGFQLFEFQALAAGKVELELIYRRPFEKGVKPAKTYKLAFEIK